MSTQKEPGSSRKIATEKSGHLVKIQGRAKTQQLSATACSNSRTRAYANESYEKLPGLY